MANKDPLFTVLKIALDEEEQAALQLKSAQLALQKSQSQLSALQNYRLDYMKQMEGHYDQNISASFYHQFHQFIRQIDEAIVKQNAHVAEATTQRTHRQSYWQDKQQKRKAVELLLEQKAVKREQVAQRQEQKMLDEFSLQQFLQKNSTRR